MATDPAPPAAHANPVTATLTALRDLVRPRRDIAAVPSSARLDDQHVVITGASSGLGRATAEDLAARGAELTIVGRRPPEGLAAQLSKVSGSASRALGCELTDLRRVRELADALLAGPPIHTLILNAGMMAKSTRVTPQGFEEMFAVHFAANVVLVRRLVAAGHLISPDGEAPPRIIVVSSEAHRSSPPIDLDHFEEPPHFGMRDGMKWYGHSKLLMLAWALDFARDHTPKRGTSSGVAVHALCPGPIASNMARESPLWVRPVLDPVMRLLFNSPAKASTPVVYFACSDEVSHTTGDYLHMLAKKAPDTRATSQEVQEQVAERARLLFAEWVS